MRMEHVNDPKKAILDEIGSIDDINVFNNQILVAIYMRPEKTKSGIILTDDTRSEDRYQGKVGLVLKKGATAFVDPDNKWFVDTNVEINDWVYFRVTDGWSVNVHGVSCRVLEDTDIRGSIQYPDAVW
jgi:co-chaperonin GroES (HSP10)